MRILFYGDSSVYGLHDPAGGWVQRIRSQLEPGENADATSSPEFYNLGIATDTAANVAKRVSFETSSRKLGPLGVIIAIGLHDSLIFDGVDMNTTELFRGELKQIKASVGQYTEDILFVGIHSVDDELCHPKAHGKKYCFTNERVWQFEQALRDYCAESGDRLVTFYEAFKERNAEEGLLREGHYPNSTGHDFIAQAVQPEVEAMVGRLTRLSA